MENKHFSIPSKQKNIIPPLIERGLYCNHLVRPSVCPSVHTFVTDISASTGRNYFIFDIWLWHGDLYRVSPFQVYRTSTSCLPCDLQMNECNILFLILVPFRPFAKMKQAIFFIDSQIINYDAKKLHEYWMKKKHSNFRKLHFLATLVEFIKETISDRGNQPTNYRKLSTQLIKKKKNTHTHQNWKNNNHFVYLTNMGNIGIFGL